MNLVIFTNNNTYEHVHFLKLFTSWCDPVVDQGAAGTLACGQHCSKAAVVAHTAKGKHEVIDKTRST